MGGSRSSQATSLRKIRRNEREKWRQRKSTEFVGTLTAIEWANCFSMKPTEPIQLYIDSLSIQAIPFFNILSNASCGMPGFQWSEIKDSIRITETPERKTLEHKYTQSFGTRDIATLSLSCNFFDNETRIKSTFKPSKPLKREKTKYWAFAINPYASLQLNFIFLFILKKLRESIGSQCSFSFYSVTISRNNWFSRRAETNRIAVVRTAKCVMCILLVFGDSVCLRTPRWSRVDFMSNGILLEASARHRIGVPRPTKSHILCKIMGKLCS